MLGALLVLILFGGLALMLRSDTLARRQERALPGGVAPASLPPALKADSPTEGPEALTLRLPEPARTEAWALLCLLQDAAPRLPERAPAERHLLTQTRERYLPETLEAYLALSPQAAAELRARGHDPQGQLLEQVRAMQAGVDAALGQDRQAADRLLTQGHFVQDRFGNKNT